MNLSVKRAVSAFAVMALTYCIPASALITGVNNGGTIIAAPASVADDFPGAENFLQEGFNEQQGVTLASNITTDQGTIFAGTTVSSHMIFLNTPGATTASHQNVTWTFDGVVLGTMSDANGTFEAGSNSQLAALGTFYPGSFQLRGLESADSVTPFGNTVLVNMQVVEPGDWIRVVTAVPVPEPSTYLLYAGFLGVAAFAQYRRRKVGSEA